MYFDFRNANLAREMTLGGKKLNLATSYNIFICNDFSDEANIQAKMRLLYAKSKMLRKKYHFCSSGYKIQAIYCIFQYIMYYVCFIGKL